MEQILLYLKGVFCSHAVASFADISIYRTLLGDMMFVITVYIILVRI